MRAFIKSLRRLVIGKAAALWYRAGSIFLPGKLESLRYDVPVRLRVPTYDGSDQAVHPDILRTDGPGRTFALAFTPYPFTNDLFENPSIVVSSDGLRFREERRGLNPLAPAPDRDHNDDPDLSLIDGTYYLFYLETLRPERQNLVLLESRDRLEWTRAAEWNWELRGENPDPMIVSPALAELNGEFFLYYVNTTERPYRVEFLKSARPDSWDRKTASLPVFDRFPFVPWHVDIVKGTGWHYLILDETEKVGDGERTYDLRLARSADLVHWTVSDRKLLDGKPFGSRLIYRSTAWCDGGDLFVYFSYKTKRMWRIGLVRKRLGDFFPDDSNMEQR
jgi:hypothetical protein